jgi:hypothetical protein
MQEAGANSIMAMRTLGSPSPYAPGQSCTAHYHPPSATSLLVPIGRHGRYMCALSPAAGCRHGSLIRL